LLLIFNMLGMTIVLESNIFFFIWVDMLAESEKQKHVSTPSGKPMFRSQTCQASSLIFYTLPESVLTVFFVRL